jgi:hypothetical protein
MGGSKPTGAGGAPLAGARAVLTQYIVGQTILATKVAPTLDLHVLNM